MQPHRADPNRLELLRLVSKGVNRTSFIRRRVSWHERSIQRWFVEMQTLDLVVSRNTPQRWGWEKVYSLTEQGQAVLQQGVLPGR